MDPNEGHGIPIDQIHNPEAKSWELEDRYERIVNRIAMDCKEDRFIFVHSRQFNFLQGCMQWLGDRYLEATGSEYIFLFVSPGLLNHAPNSDLVKNVKK